MTLLSLVLALLLEQWRPLATERQVAMPLTRYSAFLQKNFNAGQAHHGVIAWMLGVILPVLAMGVLYGLVLAVHPLAALLLNVGVLYFTMGFRRSGQYFAAIQRALNAGDYDAARQQLARWTGRSNESRSPDETIRLSVEHALIDSHRSVFAVMFWFAVLPGPTGAVLYRLARAFDERWGQANERDFGRFGWFARRAFYCLDWIPARLTATAFAVVGDFEDAVYCWRTQAAKWFNPLLGIVLASGAGAIGVRLGMPLRQSVGAEDRPELGVGDEPDVPSLDSTVGLIWRALVLWLALIFIFSIIRALS